MRTGGDDWRPLVVQTSVLTQEEFDALTLSEQADVERTTADLVRRYGREFLRHGREQHRADLRIVGYL
jgi:head-tail adaptor